MGFSDWLNKKTCAKCKAAFSIAGAKDPNRTLCDNCHADKIQAARAQEERAAQEKADYVAQITPLGLTGIAQRFSRGEGVRSAGIAIWDDVSLANKLDRLASGVAIALASGGFLGNPRKLHPVGLIAFTSTTLLCVQLGHYENGDALRSVLGPPDDYQRIYLNLKDIEIARRDGDGGLVILETTGALTMKILLPAGDDFNADTHVLFTLLAGYDRDKFAAEILSAHQEARKGTAV